MGGAGTLLNDVGCYVLLAVAYEVFGVDVNFRAVLMLGLRTSFNRFSFLVWWRGVEDVT